MVLNNDLLYRFGFIISNRKNRLGIPDNWSAEKIIYDLTIYHHYECKLSSFTFKNHKVYIMGDIFVAHGKKSLYENLSELSDLDFSSLDNLSGRFGLIFITQDNLKILSDAFGSKSLYYYNENTSDFIASSHVNLIANHLDISIDDNILKYKNSDEYQSKGTRFLPGNLTMYKEIYALSPNHCISLNKKIERFWPRKSIEKTNFKSFSILWKEYFENFISYCKEMGYRPVFGLTGGVDTRAVIAAFKGAIEVKTMTWSRGINNDEKEIILDLEKFLKTSNSWIDVNEKNNSQLFELQREVSHVNTGFSRTKSTLTAQLANITKCNDIFIRGLGGEILRGMYNYSNSRSNKDVLSYAEYLYNGYILSLKDKSQFYDDFTKDNIINFFEINDYNEIIRFGLDIGDLIYWEQRMGMWASNQMLESDSAIKSFVGINSRKLYECAYGLPAEVRFSKNLLIELVKLYDEEFSNISFI